ncbi:MAG: YihY/virulence factor BrkB family protein [Halanaeroarchaeum sp.]
MTRRETIVATVRAVVETIRETQVTFLAAAVAYFGFLSIVPLLLLAIFLGGVLGIDVSAQVVSLVGDMVTPAGEDAIASALDASGIGSGITILGVAVLLWSALRVFRALDIAFSTIYGLGSPKPLYRQVVDALLVLVAVAVAVVAVTIVGVVLPVLRLGPLAQIGGPLTLFGTLVVAFAPLYYWFPDVELTIREILPGTVLAAAGWTIMAAVFGAYAQLVPSFHLYGVLGAALLVVTWLYLSGIIIMVGAVVNAVLAGRTDDDADGIADEDRRRIGPAPDVEAIGREVEELRESLEAKTVSKADLESDLKRYVRRKRRRGKARGWGPYLVLLYGTIMTLGAFYWLEGGWAILAMVVVWLSTLGLYVLMVLFGVGFSALGLPGSLLDKIRERRS